VRYGLEIGARCAPLVLGMMYLFCQCAQSPLLRFAAEVFCVAPIAYPIARLLDRMLGANETHTYKKAELKSFLQFHRHGEEPLRDDEISILNGVLELNNKSVEMLMTPLKVSVFRVVEASLNEPRYAGQDVVSLSSDTILDHKTVDAMCAL
jgi:metal transporter CNNM